MLKTEINPKKICKCQQIRVSLRQFLDFEVFFTKSRMRLVASCTNLFFVYKPFSLHVSFL